MTNDTKPIPAGMLPELSDYEKVRRSALEDKLLRCPFCGTQATLRHTIVACDGCGVEMTKLLSEPIDAVVDGWNKRATEAVKQSLAQPAPIDMILHCPACGLQHVDAPDERTPDWKNEPHRSHLCHGCGNIWRPADVATNGVASIKTVGKNDCPKAQPAPQIGLVSACDDGSEVWLDSYSGGAHKDGLWTHVSLLFKEADGSTNVRQYREAQPAPAQSVVPEGKLTCKSFEHKPCCKCGIPAQLCYFVAPKPSFWCWCCWSAR